MSYVNASEMLRKAGASGYAVCAFNILNHLTAGAVVDECGVLHAPVILQTSVSTVKAIGPERLIGFLRLLAEKAPVPVAVHLDHCKDVALAKTCIDCGWSSIMLDASHLPLEENIRLTADIVQYAKGKNITVEGEIGAVSGVEDNVSVDEQDATVAKVEDCVKYVEASGIDLLAPAIGTAHGMYKSAPNINFDRLAEVRKAVSLPLVVHGGTGLSNETFRRLIGLGASKINISTALKIAYLSAAKSFFENTPEDGNPLHFDALIIQYVRDTVRTHVQLFGSAGKA